MNNNYLKRVEDILEVKHFYELDHQKIYEKLKLGFSDNITLADYFEANFKELGGKNYITALLSHSSLIVDIRDYAFKVIELWKKLELKEKIEKVLQELEISNIDDSINDLETTIKEIDENNTALAVFTGEEMAQDWALSLQTESKPVPTNFRGLDDLLNGGFYPENLYVFAAASGVGKTFISQFFMLNALKQQMGVLFISMEMPKKAIYSRFLSLLSGINAFRLKINNIYKHEEEKLSQAIEDWKIYQKNFFITEKPYLSPKNIEVAIKSAKRKSKIDFIVIDYAQILKLRDARNFNEASLIKENITQIAGIAKKYEVSIMLLSQLTKDKINGKITLNSLKGSGGLYEDADCVIGMYSKEDEQKTDVKKLAVEILKNRNGPEGEISIIFDGRTAQFNQTDF